MRQLKFWTANTRASKNENTSSNKSLLLLFSPDQAKVVPPVNNSVNSKASLVTNGNCKLEKKESVSSEASKLSTRRTEQHQAAAVVTGRNGNKLAAYEFAHLADGHCSAWTRLDWPGHWRCSSSREKKVKSKRKDTNRTLTTLCLPQTSNHRGESRESRGHALSRNRKVSARKHHHHHQRHLITHV